MLVQEIYMKETVEKNLQLILISQLSQQVMLYVQSAHYYLYIFIYYLYKFRNAFLFICWLYQLAI